MNRDHTKRFSNRVEDYIKYRPGYPKELIGLLKQEIGLNQTKIIADIGSGTGKSSKPFLENGNFVYGVEPNKEMRAAQEIILNGHANFKSIDGTAEQTKLPDKSIDVIFCGQAFHWFDKEKSKKEFLRILRPNGHMVLAWNSRSTNTAFQKEYEQTLYATIEAYKKVNHRNIEDADISHFFHPKPMKLIELEQVQQFDLKGLKGRLKSSSYCPKEGREYETLMREIEKLFEKFKLDGKVAFKYETQIYCS